MFDVGDKIVYPMHGAGIIKAIEEKELFGEIGKYYSVNIVSEGMDILIPIEKEEEIGIRTIGGEAEIQEMFEALTQPMEEMVSNWSKRYQSNLEKLKTGNLTIVAGVVRNLTLMDRRKGLSSGEKRMLFSAKNFLISEIMMIQHREKAEADEMIESHIQG